jgi:molybdopterin-containing oxidoreductase family membrane subunit
VGLLPDLAAVRDRAAPGWRQRIFAILSFGWNGSTRTWHRYEVVYLLLAGLATPLVLSVHSIVSMDFATSVIPGWHTTIFPPYFVAGAIFSGVAMMMTLLIPMRTLLGLEDYITVRHFENLAKVLIVTSLIITYAYACDFFMAWYSASAFERGTYADRATGAYAPLFWTMVFCNSFVPLALFWKRVRTDLRGLFVISILINVGMWLERFVIIVSSLAHSFDPAQWTGFYDPTWVEAAITAGGFAWFFLLFLLFVKNFPVISMTEIKGMVRYDGSAGAPHG